MVAPARSIGRSLLVAFASVFLGTGVLAAQQNPLVGGWRQVGWKLCQPRATLPPGSLDPPLEELLFKPDGTFAATWTPFETYKDYWGHYRYAVARQGARAARALPPDTVAARLVSGPWFEGTIELVVEGGNFIPSDFQGTGTFAVEGRQLTLRGVRLGTRRAPHPVRLCEVTLVKQF